MEFEYPDRHPFGLGIPAEEFATRMSRFQHELRQAGHGAADVWGSGSEPGDIAYLSNHFPPVGTVAWLHVPAGGAAVLYSDSHRPDLVMVSEVRPLAERPNPFPAGEIPAVLARMREIKSPAELALLEGAATIAAVGLEAGLATVIAGATERQVAAAAIAAAISAGADECRCVVRSGRWTDFRERWPDASDEQLKSGELVVVEVHGACQGYRFLEARTVRTGEGVQLPELDHALQAVLAELVPGSDLATVLRRTAPRLAEHGCRIGGWGIGLSEREPPFLGPGEKGSLLRDQAMVLALGADGALLRRAVAIGPGGAHELGRLST